MVQHEILIIPNYDNALVMKTLPEFFKSEILKENLYIRDIKWANDANPELKEEITNESIEVNFGSIIYRFETKDTICGSGTRWLSDREIRATFKLTWKYSDMDYYGRMIFNRGKSVASEHYYKDHNHLFLV